MDDLQEIHTEIFYFLFPPFQLHVQLIETFFIQSNNIKWFRNNYSYKTPIRQCSPIHIGALHLQDPCIFFIVLYLELLNLSKGKDAFLPYKATARTIKVCSNIWKGLAKFPLIWSNNRMVMIKLYLCLTKHYTMKAYGGVNL
jgi:hypothetical protein